MIENKNISSFNVPSHPFNMPPPCLEQLCENQFMALERGSESHEQTNKNIYAQEEPFKETSTIYHRPDNMLSDKTITAVQATGSNQI